MDLRKENELIKWDAEFALKQCEDRASSIHIEMDYVVKKFIKEFFKMAKERGYMYREE